jgi:hypothetical protein
VRKTQIADLVPGDAPDAGSALAQGLGEFVAGFSGAADDADSGYNNSSH